MTIKLGVIGLSTGNGHPYSWSAIFNGYNHKFMKDCGYPTIPEYLEKESWPEARILEAEVTSIWTQDKTLSEKIAKASLIKHVSSNLTELEQRVDAVLLARDDAENHLEFALQFLKVGKPIYIDKPIALSISSLNELYNHQQYEGQIFTCSALRYSPELFLTIENRKEIGEIVSISSSIPNSWKKYSVHIIEPVLAMLSSSDNPKRIERVSDAKDISTLKGEWESGIETSFSTLGNVKEPISIKVVGLNGEIELIFENTFTAFKNALQDFVNGITDGDCKSPFEFNAKVVNLIERGIK